MQLFSTISLLSGIMPILAYVLLGQQKRRLVYILTTVSVLLTFLKDGYYYCANTTDYVVFNIYAILNSSILLLLFSHLFTSKGFLRSVVLLLMTLSAVFWYWDNFLSNNIYACNYRSILLQHLLVIGICLRYYYEQMQTDVLIHEAVGNSYFWIVSATLIFSAATFFSFFLPNRSTLGTNNTLVIFEYFGLVGNMLKNSLFLIAFFSSRKLQSNHSLKNLVASA